MAVRRLHPDQPDSFAFSPENLAWAERLIAKYPPGKQASAVIPLLWRGQEQNGGWVSEPMIRVVADMLGMAHIRVLEVATFYTQFQLSPVGDKAHVQVCGTTPCMLRGAGELIEVCKRRIHHDPFHRSADGAFSWEEVECLGACVNAPMVLIGKDTYEDLTAETFGQVLDGFAAGRPPKPGTMIERQNSAPFGGATTLGDPSLYDGSMVGAWKKRFEEAERAKAEAAAAAKAAAEGGAAKPAEPAKPAEAAKASEPAKAAEATRASEPAKAAATGLVTTAKPAEAGSAATAAAVSPGARPELVASPRGGKGDDLTLIWGVADKLQEKLNAMGIWHFDQIAKWTPENVAWFEAELSGFAGRVARDKWIEQCQKLATGWRPDSAAGERPKG
ncbi:MAG: NADH-quinone oxidoreductase subunit NuoE [Hyphomicrobiaceae bacterium]